MQTRGQAPDCAVCSLPGDCPYDYILNEASDEEYEEWLNGQHDGKDRQL